MAVEIASDVSRKIEWAYLELEQEQKKDLELRIALAFAIEELDRARSQIPMTPSPCSGRRGLRKVRGGRIHLFAE